MPPAASPPDALPPGAGAPAPRPATPRTAATPALEGTAQPEGAGPVDGSPPAPAAAPAGDLVRTCAWCRRTVHADGTWRASDGPPATPHPVRVTHGICPACYAAATRS